MSPDVVHPITVEHRWGHPELFRYNVHSFETVQICLDCGADHRCLHLTARHNSLRPEEELKEDPSKVQQLVGLVQQIIEALNEIECNVFQGTDYSNLQQFAEEMELRYQPAINRNDVTFGLAAHLAGVRASSKPARKRVRSILMAHKQGLVCNRCDSVAESSADLTEDHIIPKEKGGQAQLPNLQLLCRKCNLDKGNGPPGHRDVSPFLHQGPACKHRIKCTEIR